MDERGGILSEEQQKAAMAVTLRAHDALAAWAARDQRPGAGDGVPPLDALTQVDGEDLASALTLAAASLGAAETRGQNTTQLREALDLLLAETVARLTGGGGPAPQDDDGDPIHLDWRYPDPKVSMIGELTRGMARDLVHQLTVALRG